MAFKDTDLLFHGKYRNSTSKIKYLDFLMAHFVNHKPYFLKYSSVVRVSKYQNARGRFRNNQLMGKATPKMKPFDFVIAGLVEH